jgi:phosphoribosylformylglycinamidine cyclo-ligase
MGAGFALFVAHADVPAAIEVAASAGVQAWHAGQVESGDKSLVIEPLGITFAASDLHLRA